MLIIAQPKSASTSLLHGLGEITNRHSAQVFTQLRHGKEAEEFGELPHSDMVEHPDMIQKMAEADEIYKQHFPPTGPNMKVVREMETPIVLTLRKPMDAFFAYERAPDVPHELTENKYRQMVKWHRRWNEGVRGFDHVLVVFFETLINHQAKTVNHILEHFGMDERVDGDYQLPTERYSGDR